MIFKQENTMLNKSVVTGAILSMFVVTGCATQTETGASSSSSNSTEDYDRQINTQEAEINSLESRINSRDSRIQQLEAELARSGSSTGGMSSASDELFPPNAQPGECYARVLFPEQYRTSEERQLVRQASERFEVIPASYETVTERVLVSEASTRLEVIPAVYGTVEERVLVRAASTKIVEVPATYKTESEQVLEKAAHTVWKKGSPEAFGGSSVVSQSVNGTGELMCLVEVPATYRTVTRTVIDTPATTREIEIPAEYKTVTRRVVTTPATTREVTIPAVYDDVQITKLATPATSRRIEIPEEYRTVTKREKVSDARLEWQQVLCEVNATNSVVYELQKALDAKGYDVGGIDGRLGPTTITAVNKYAKSLGIAQGANYVPMDVLENLGIDF